ncbi:MAG: M48 family metallopeptidase [Nitrososphaeria archaeon]
MLKRVKLGNKYIPYKIKYNRVKYARIEVREKWINLVLPYGFTQEEQLITKHAAWIEKKLNEYEALRRKSHDLKLQHRNASEFKALIGHIINNYTHEMNTSLPVIKYRKMKRKWASMNSNHILTVNWFMSFLPEPMISYILYHEMCHIFEMSHNSKFKNLIKKRYDNYKDFDKELKAYWIAIKSHLYMTSDKR